MIWNCRKCGYECVIGSNAVCCPVCGGEFECPLSSAYDEWQENNPTKQPYEFGFSLAGMACKIRVGRTHYTTDGSDPICDCEAEG